MSPRDARRQFITGFTGSAGTAVITQDEALLWTDGRYYQQAEKQLDENWTLMKDGLPETPTLTQWLIKNCRGLVGVDATLYSTRAWNTLVTAFENENCSMAPIKQNLIDLVWTGRPPPPLNPIITLDVKYTGKTIAEKLVEIRAKMKEHSAKVLLVTALDEVACEFMQIFRRILF